MPHWQQSGATYFITFRLADSIPQTRLSEWIQQRRIWLQWHPQPWSAAEEVEYFDRFGESVERWLDQLSGSCILRVPDRQQIVAEALMHFNGQRYAQHAWVIMPNHVHVLVSLAEDWTLQRILQSWKGFTAHELNRDGIAHDQGGVWQKDYFDRLVRNEDHFWRCVNYIRQNPTGLREGEYLLWESEEIRAALNSQ